MTRPRLVAVVGREYAALAGLPVELVVERRQGERRRGRAQDHGRRTAQQRQRARLTLYPKLVVVEDRP